MADEPKKSEKWSAMSPEEREAWLDWVMESRGFKPAPPDHPIYREGPTVILIGSKAKPKKSGARK